MNEHNFEQYQKRVDELGQALLDVIASVSIGNFDVEINIPEEIEIFSDLAVGLEFMIEDLRELASDKERSHLELEHKISERTRELETTLAGLQTPQQQFVEDEWQTYSLDKSSVNALTFSRESGIEEAQTWLPTMEKAVRGKTISHEANGQDLQSLALPIQLQDEVIGVIGFNRKNDETWTPRDIATVEAIAEQVGLALENQRLFDRTQAALAEADTLYKATSELNIAQNYTDILNALQKYSAMGQRAASVQLFLFGKAVSLNEKPGQIAMIAQVPEQPASQLPVHVSAENAGSLIDSILSPDRIVQVDNFNQDGLLASQAIAAEASAASFIPLVVAGNWIGYISCVYQAAEYFSEDEHRRTSALSSQASVAIQNLRSIDLAEQRAREAQKRSEELALINRVVSSVAAAPDLRESLKLIAEELNMAVTVDETGIALFNPAGTLLTTIAFESKLTDLPSMAGTEIPIAENTPVMQVMNTRKALVIRADAATEPSPLHEILEIRKYKTLLLMPLITGNEVIGIIFMGLQSADEEFKNEEMRLAETILLQASTAIQNSRLLDQTQAALTETASLYQANKDLNAVQSHGDILHVLQQHTLLGQNAIYNGIFLFDTPWTITTPPSSLTPISQWAQDESRLLLDTPISFSEWPRGEDFLKSDSLRIIKNLNGDPRISGAFRDLFIETHHANMVISAPLAVAGRWVGQIFASYPAVIEFPESEQRRLIALSGQAAIAIENIGLLEETSRRANQLETAADIAQQSSSTLDTDALLNRAVNLIRERFGFYHSSIFLLEDDQAYVAASTGEAGRQLVETKHSLPVEQGRSIIGHVCHTGEPLIVNDITQNPTHKPHPLLQETRAEVGIPLKIGPRVIGALDVQSLKSNIFTEDDVAVLQTLADQIAIALENARSYELSQQAVEEIREVDRLKSEFLANMSHELRTPLNSIIGFSRVIIKGIDGPITDLQKQDLEAIHHSGQHLLDMINNILDVSKIEAGKMEIHIEEVQLIDVIDSVMATTRGLVKEKPIQLINNTPEQLPVVNADRTRVRQILLNLLQNAVKFTDEGSIIVDIERVSDQESQAPFLKVIVTDTGIGIAQEDQDKLFERFSQVDSSLTRKVGGTGLGLSITKHLVEMQGGEIQVASTVGEGSSFWFTLPIALEDEAKNPELDDEILPGAKIILSIDDDENVIDLYKRYLQPHGFHVIPITNPGNINEQILSANPFAVTLDIMMPNIDGWQVIEEIKSNPETARIPVIICSIVEDRDRAYQLGAVDYLVKPILEDEMVESLKRLKFSQEKDFHEVLVIDDDPNVFQLVEIALRNEAGYKLTYANGGFAGLEILKENQPSVVILDLVMPDLDGFSILETMQGDPLLRDIPVIIFTAADLSDEEREKIAKTKRDVLKKDVFKGEQLINILETTLNNLSE